MRCSIKGCKSDNRRKISVSFHSFPDDPELRSVWIAATKRKGWIPKPSSKICSEHFHKKLLWRKGNRTYLNHDAVPVPVPTKLSVINTHIDETMQIEVNSEVKIEFVNVDSVASSSTVAPMEIQHSEIVPVVHASETHKNLPVYGKSPDCTLQTLKRKLMKAQDLSQLRLKKLKALREKSRRLVKKVANLENILAKLQSKLLIQSEDCELLASIDTTSKDL